MRGEGRAGRGHLSHKIEEAEDAAARHDGLVSPERSMEIRSEEERSGRGYSRPRESPRKGEWQIPLRNLSVWD